MISLEYHTDTERRDITGYTGRYSRSDSLESLGMAFRFTLSDGDPEEDRTLEVGGRVTFTHNGTTVFSGIIVTMDRRSLTEYEYTAFDYAFYLNKSEVMIQFNDIPITEALTRLCSENDIPVGTITKISTKVTKIYSGSVISDVIRDLLKIASDETGARYRLEVRDNKLFIEDYKELVVQTEYQPAAGPAFDPILCIGSMNAAASMEDMKNRVIVMSSNEKNAQILAQVKDQDGIGKFGLLTKVEKIDDKNESQAANIAEKLLNDLNRIRKSFRVTLFGDDRIRSGRTIVFRTPEIGLEGAFLVKSCQHDYTGDFNHTMTLEVDA